ncbi:glycosyltransferase family 2 protein [Helicobacter sp. 23-1045]
MQNNPKVGVVIPIYNVAPYLRECLDSVLAQTYGNFHAVLVNDGSTDILEGESKSESLKIALEYVARDKRFVLIDKANGGLSSARNAGISYFANSLVGNSSLTQSSRKFEKFSLDEPIVLSHSNFSAQPTNLAQDTRIAEDSKDSSLRDSQRESKQSKDSSSLAEDSQMTFYTHPNHTNLTPPKIDYIIFLDSDDFWEADLLEKCVDSAIKHNAEIVWFSWHNFIDGTPKNSDTPNTNGGGGFSWISSYKYTQKGVICGVDVLNRARELNRQFLSNAWDILIDWRYLQNINLRFLDGVIWEDVLFAELLFAQSARIALLPLPLTNYRIRRDSTQNFASFKQKILPPFVAPLQKYFADTNTAWAYFSAFSWVKIAVEFAKFLENHSNKNLCHKLQSQFLAHLLAESSAIMDFECDPYQMQGEFLAMAGRFGGKYLPKSKRRYAYYNSPILWRIYGIYTILSAIKRRIKKIWKS